jgi:hypothetical protein
MAKGVEGAGFNETLYDPTVDPTGINAVAEVAKGSVFAFFFSFLYD